MMTAFGSFHGAKASKCNLNHRLEIYHSSLNPPRTIAALKLIQLIRRFLESVASCFFVKTQIDAHCIRSVSTLWMSES
jgi:hypothetical protein